MAILLVLFGLALLPGLVFLFTPKTRRTGAVRVLPAVSGLLVAVALLFIVAVNVGWVSP